MSEQTCAPGHVTPDCDDDGCFCPDDVFWGRLLGDRDPCTPGKDWVAAAFTEGPVDMTSSDDIGYDLDLHPHSSGKGENCAAQLRAALGGDGGGMGPATSLEGPGGDKRGQGRVSGHLGERQDGSGR